MRPLCTVYLCIFLFVSAVYTENQIDFFADVEGEWNYILAIPWFNKWTISQGIAQIKMEKEKINITLIDSEGKREINIQGEVRDNMITKAIAKPAVVIGNPYFEGFKGGYCGQSIEGGDLPPCTDTIFLTNPYGLFIGLTRKNLKK